MRRSLLATLVFLALSTFALAAAAGPPKPGKCAVASAGIATDSDGGSAWMLAASVLGALALVRRVRR